jgi:hypothetical protein
MLLLTSFRLRLLLAGGLGLAADSGTPLRVLRSTPAGAAAPITAVTVTFDRPVAGSLDRTVDPARIFVIEPAVAGRLDWRDPVTVRFRPLTPLTPNTTYRVTVRDSFEAMDGSRLVARRYPPGTLRPPREAGAVPVRICRLSGLLAWERCPTATEWVPAGDVPAAVCDWHLADGVRLPAEYADWEGAAQPAWRPMPAAQSGGATTALRIVSPREGDRYRVPPGVPARYATLPLRATASAPVRWYVDGAALRGSRWILAPGSHRVEARTARERDAVRIDVFD